MRNAMFTVLAAAVALGGFVAAPAQAAPEFVIKLATVAPAGTPWANHMNDIKKRIEKASGGRVKMKIFLGSSLGGEVETIRALRRGRIQAWGGSTAAVAEGARIPQLQLMELPFLFASLGEADHVLDTIVADDFIKILADKGFTFGMWHENGWRNFATKSKPVLKVADIAGVKMRSQESPVHLAMYKALGAQAESIPVPEVLGALKTGMVDGFDNTPLFSSATGWYEGVKHYTISQHIYQPAVILYNKKFLDGMPEDLRKIVLGDPRAEGIKGRHSVRSMRGDLLNIFRSNGIKVHELTDAQRKPFADATRKVHREFAGRIGKGLLNKVYAAQKAYRARGGK